MTYHETLAARVLEILRELGEHHDAIQILGSTVDDDGNTRRLSMGIGNWYARQGLAREFLEMDAAATTAFELSKVLCEDEDDED